MKYAMLIIPFFLLTFLYGGEKQCLTLLRHQLRQAHKELSQAQERVMKLEECIAQKEIARIRKELDVLQKQEVVSKLPSSKVFAEQRETLAWIIRSQPEYAKDAQVVLDEILSLITLIGDRLVTDESVE